MVKKIIEIRMQLTNCDFTLSMRLQVTIMVIKVPQENNAEPTVLSQFLALQKQTCSSNQLFEWFNNSLIINRKLLVAMHPLALLCVYIKQEYQNYILQCFSTAYIFKTLTFFLNFTHKSKNCTHKMLNSLHSKYHKHVSKANICKHFCKNINL